MWKLVKRGDALHLRVTTLRVLGKRLCSNYSVVPIKVAWPAIYVSNQNAGSATNFVAAKPKEDGDSLPAYLEAKRRNNSLSTCSTFTRSPTGSFAVEVSAMPDGQRTRVLSRCSYRASLTQITEVALPSWNPRLNPLTDEGHAIRVEAPPILQPCQFPVHIDTDPS